MLNKHKYPFFVMLFVVLSLLLAACAVGSEPVPTGDTASAVEPEAATGAKSAAEEPVATKESYSRT